MCLRCCDPKELNTYLSALKCLKCPVGYFLPTDTLEDSCEWCCEDCGAKVPNEYAVNVNEQVATTIQVLIIKGLGECLEGIYFIKFRIME